MKPDEKSRFGPATVTLRTGSLLTLRFLSPEDAPALGDFYASVPREDFRFYCPHALTRQEADRTARRADMDGFVCTVAEADGGLIAGYAWYECNEPDTCTFGICLRRQFQGVGLGAAIMRRLFEVAREAGPPRMRLTVQIANAAALALYLKMGFAVVEERECPERWGFAPEMEYVMERATR